MTITKRDNHCHSSAGVAIGSTPSQFSTTRTVTVNIGGRAISVPAVATKAFSLTGVASLAARQTCAFAIVADNTGTLTSIQSPVYAASDAPSGYTPGAFEYPDPAGQAVVGVIVVKSGAAAFVPGTTSLAGIATYIDAALDYGKPILF